jgi:hypothetical protein
MPLGSHRSVNGLIQERWLQMRVVSGAQRMNLGDGYTIDTNIRIREVGLRWLLYIC